MRYIYKAKDLNGNWVHGAYFKFLPYTPVPIRECEPPESDYKHLIIKEGFSDWNLPRDLKVIEINPETLCQCTGMKDKNNINIFENDIVITPDYYRGDFFYPSGKYTVEWDNGFHVNYKDLSEINDLTEIVGNKFG